MDIKLHGNIFELLPEKALYWREHKLMIVADLHLGKTMHFRKAGIIMPEASALKDYDNLETLVAKYQPTHLCFLGDLFHSHYNSEWRLLESFIAQKPELNFSLIRGNHDILKKQDYNAINIEVIEAQLVLGNVILSHIPITNPPGNYINISGHLHPGCVLKGLGKQTVKLPCFVHYIRTLLLPAFGHLTGLQVIDQKGAAYYAVAGKEIIAV